MGCRAVHTVCMANENGVMAYYKPGAELPPMSKGEKDDLLSRKAIECDQLTASPIEPADDDAKPRVGRPRKHSED